MAAVSAVWCGPGWSLTGAVHEVVGRRALRPDYGRVPGSRPLTCPIGK
jgi:hypothetical protein